MHYEYELRRGDTVIATGHLTRDEPVSVGDRITIGAHTGIVKTELPTVRDRPARIKIALSHSN